MRSFFFALLVIAVFSALTMAQGEETAAATTEQDNIVEASDFVVGLNALNNQIINGLDQLPSRKVIVLPFADSEGNYGKVSHFLKEQMVTAIVGSQKYLIVDGSELFELISNNNIPPLDFGKSEAFQLVKDRYLNVSIVVGSLTDLSKKYAVMTRIIVGSTGNFGGGATVYLRAEEEMAVLLGQMVPDRKTVEKTPDAQRAGDNKQTDPKLVEIAPPGSRASDTSSSDSSNTSQPDKDPGVRILPRQDFVPDVQGKNDLAIYRIGRDMFTRNRFPESIAYFDKVLELFPESPLADNALYWKAEAHYSIKEWKKAHEIFQYVLDKYPYGNKVPAATLKRGYTEEKMGMLKEAIASMEEVVTRFENSEVAVTARRKLQLLRALAQ